MTFAELRATLGLTHAEVATLTWRSSARVVRDWETGHSTCPAHVWRRLLALATPPETV